MTEDVLAQSGDDALGRRRQQKDLNEVHQALQREEPEQSDGDVVEERAVARLERRVEQISNDEREGEADGGGNDETERGEQESTAKWPQARQQAPQGTWGAEAALGRRRLLGRRRGQTRTARSTTIATNSSARYRSENRYRRQAFGIHS